jgi:hypothetical protein
MGAYSGYGGAVTFASLTVVVTFALIALSALSSRLREPAWPGPTACPCGP